MASWLVHLTLYQAVQVRALAGGHSVVFLCKTFNSHSVSLHKSVRISTSKFYSGGNPGWTSFLCREGYICIAAFCYRNWVKL